MPAAIAIAAHPDDIEFLMSGTLMLLRSHGYQIHYWNLANGCCGSAASAWSGLSRISTKRVGSAACTSADTRTFLKRLLIHTSGFNLGLLMRQLLGVGTPRGLQGRLIAVVAALLVLTRELWQLVTLHPRLVRHVSPLEAPLHPESAVAHIGERELVFTTGC